MGKKRLALDRDKNPKYYKLGDDHFEIMKCTDALNKKIMTHPPKKFIPFSLKKNIREFRKELISLNPNVFGWTANLDNFLLRPEFIFVDDQEYKLGYHHYMAELRDMRLRVNERFELTFRNYENVARSYNEQRNFLIAISSFALSFAGLLWALFASPIVFEGTNNGLSGTEQFGSVDSLNTRDTLNIIQFDTSSAIDDSLAGGI